MADVSRALDHLREQSRQSFQLALFQVAQETRAEAPVRSGALQASVGATVTGESGSVLTGEVEASAPYALWVDEDTRPHPIEGNPLLAFFWPRAGRTIVVRHVNHPGTTGQHFFKKPMPERWRRALEENFARTS